MCDLSYTQKCRIVIIKHNTRLNLVPIISRTIGNRAAVFERKIEFQSDFEKITIVENKRAGSLQSHLYLWKIMMNFDWTVWFISTMPSLKFCMKYDLLSVGLFLCLCTTSNKKDVGIKGKSKCEDKVKSSQLFLLRTRGSAWSWL